MHFWEVAHVFFWTASVCANGDGLNLLRFDCTKQSWCSDRAPLSKQGEDTFAASDPWRYYLDTFRLRNLV